MIWGCLVLGFVRIHLLLCILLTSLFLVYGCTEPKINKEDHTKLFEESEISLNENIQILSIRKISNDLYICSYIDPQTQQYGLAYTDPTFSKFEPITNDVANLVHAGNQTQSEYTIGFYLNYATDPAGNLYILQHKRTNSSETNSILDNSTIFVYDSEGNLQRQVPISKPQQIQNMVPVNLLVQSERFIILSYSGIQVTDMYGNTLAELAVPSNMVSDPLNLKEQLLPIGLIIDADLINDHDITLIQDRSGKKFIIVYSLEEYRLIWEKELPEYFNAVAVHYESSQRQIIVASYEKLFIYGMDGEELGELINFNEYASGIHNAQVFNGNQALKPGYFVFSDPHRFYVYLIDAYPGQIRKLYSYRLLQGEEKSRRIAELEKEKANKTKIILHVPYVDGTIEQKIARYEYANPDIDIELTYFRKEEEEFNSNDYMSHVNLQLLTNKAEWDIMAVQYLPHWKYSEKGYFADLGQIAPDWWKDEKEKFHLNIIEALRHNGKWYVMPARISASINLVNKDMKQSIAPYEYTWTDLIQLIDQMKQTALDIKPWNFSGGLFDSAYSFILRSYLPDILDSGLETTAKEHLISDFLTIALTLNNPEDYARQNNEAALFMFSDLTRVHLRYSVNLANNNFELFPAPATPISGKHSFYLHEGYAINNESKVKEEAFKLITFLAEYGEPNNLLLKRTFEDLDKQMGTTDEHKKAIQQLQKIVESLDVLYRVGYGFPGDIYTTTEQFVNGIIDKETAVKTVMEKLWLYENE